MNAYRVVLILGDAVLGHGYHQGVIVDVNPAHALTPGVAVRRVLAASCPTLKEDDSITITVTRLGSANPAGHVGEGSA